MNGPKIVGVGAARGTSLREREDEFVLHAPLSDQRGILASNALGANIAWVADGIIVPLLALARHAHAVDRFVRVGS